MLFGDKVRFLTTMMMDYSKLEVSFPEENWLSVTLFYPIPLKQCHLVRGR